MSDLLTAFLEEIENIQEDNIISKEQSKQGIITGFKERDENKNNTSLKEKEATLPNNANKRAEYLRDRDIIKNSEEIENLINAGIHPNILYDKPKWTTKDNEVIRLEGIHKTGSHVLVTKWDFIENPETHRWSFKPILDPKTKKPYLEGMTSEDFLKIIHSPINANIYADIMKNESEDPDDWLEEFNIANKRAKNNFELWYEKNKEDYELDKYDKVSLIGAYKLINTLHLPITKALQRKGKKITEEVITEDENTLTYAKDPRRVKKILTDMGISDKYTEQPFYMRYDTTGDPDEDEQDIQYIIWGVKKEGNNYDTVLLKEFNKIDPNTNERILPKKGQRAQEFSIDAVKEMIDNFENSADYQGGKPHIEDFMNSMSHQRFRGNKGAFGKWQELTNSQMYHVLQLMNNDKEFEGENLLQYYDNGTNTKRLRLALQMFEPKMANNIRVVSNEKTGHAGYKYYICIPDEESKTIEMPIHGTPNPWKQFIRRK